MTDLDFIVAPVEQVFRVRRRLENNPALWMAGGIGLLAFAVVGFAVSVFSNIDMVTRQVMTTMPVVAGIGCIAAARSMKSTPEEVGVGPDGLRLVEGTGGRTYGWNEVGWCKVDSTPMGGRKVLTVFDTAGKPLLRLSDSIDGFHDMVAMVQGYIAAKPDATATRIQTSKARRQAALLVGGGALFLAVAIAVAIITAGDIRAERLLKTSAVPGRGTIVRRFLAPNGVTPRLEYEVRTPDGKAGTRNAEVERDYWDSLANARTVSVVYVPGEPGISRLATGEVAERDSFANPVIGYGLPAVVGLMALGFISVGVMGLRGWDIDMDSKTGRVSIKRFGEGR